MKHPGVWHPLLESPLSRDPAQPSPTPSRTPQNATFIPWCFSGVPASHFARFPLSPPSPPLPSSHMPPPLRTFLPLGLGVKAQDQAHGPAQQQRDRLLLATCLPFRKDRRQRTPPATRPANVIMMDAPDFRAVRVSARRKLDTIPRRVGTHSARLGSSTPLGTCTALRRMRRRQKLPLSLLLLLLLLPRLCCPECCIRMLHQVTQREVRARVITERQCRCGELGRGSWPHLWSPSHHTPPAGRWRCTDGPSLLRFYQQIQWANAFWPPHRFEAEEKLRTWEEIKQGGKGQASFYRVVCIVGLGIHHKIHPPVPWPPSYTVFWTEYTVVHTGSPCRPWVLFAAARVSSAWVPSLGNQRGGSQISCGAA